MPRSADHVAEQLLVLRARDGDALAFSVLVEAYHPALLRHAARLTDDPASAADAVQDAWLAVVRGVRRLDDPSRFRAWVYRIVTNKCADRVRRKTTDRAAMKSMNRLTPGNDQQAGDEAAAVRDAIRRLPPDRRALLGMLYVDGLSVAQIASALGIPPGTVKSRLHTARNELKQIIERTEDAQQYR